MRRMIAAAGQMQAHGDKISRMGPTLTSTPSPSSFLKLDVAYYTRLPSIHYTSTHQTKS
jgi:hypothetical protein